MSIKLGIYLFLVFLFVAGCQSGNVAKKSVNSIPMESVDANTGGEKGGGTHFSISSDELFLDYQHFDDEAAAGSELDQKKLNAKQVIEHGNVLGNGGVIAGKFAVTEEHTRYESDRFCLRWTRVNRYTQVCSASRQAIEEFRTDYDL